MEDITELQAVDFALGAAIANSFNSLTTSGPKNYQKFLARATNQKIFRKDHVDANALIRGLSNSEKQTGGPQLPIVAYFRKPGMSNGDSYASVEKRNMTVEVEGSTAKDVEISILPVSLEYSMTFAAWDKPTLDKMQLAWYAYISPSPRKNSRFMVPTLIDGELFEVAANFLDPKTVMFSDSSPEKSDAARVYSVSTDFTINTQVLVGKGVTISDEITILGVAGRYLQ